MINRRIVIGLLLLVLVVGGAFLFEGITKIKGSQSGQLVPVMQNDKTIAYYDAGVIRQLSLQERELKRDQGGSVSDNKVSLSFALGSAGIDDYEYVLVTGLGDNEEFKLKRGETESMVLSSNNNGTFSLVNQSGGNRVIVKEVARFYVAD